MSDHLTTPSHEYMDLLLDAICVVDKDGRFLQVSAACEHIFGYRPQELTGRQMLDFVHPDDRACTLDKARQVMNDMPLRDFENRYVRKDGRIVHIMWSARWYEADQVRIAVARDVSRRKQAEAVQSALLQISEAAHSADELQGLYEHIHRIMGTLLPVANLTIVLREDGGAALNFAYNVCQQWDLSPFDTATLGARVMDSGLPLLLKGDDGHGRPVAGSWLGVPLSTHRGVMGALVIHRCGDDRYYSEADQELLQFVSAQIASAIERSQMQARLRYFAFHDPLTGLPNRALLYDRMRTAIARAERDQTGVAVVFLDLNKFKDVNDQHGHAVGDTLLQRVAERLQSCVRASDTVARLGGDEFVVLVDDPAASTSAGQLVSRIVQGFGEHFEVDGQTFQMSPSLGIAYYPTDGCNEYQLLRHADEAMFLSKRT